MSRKTRRPEILHTPCPACSRTGVIQAPAYFHSGSTCLDCARAAAARRNERYRQTEKGKRTNRKSCEKYRKTEKGKAANQRYRQSPKGRAARNRAQRKRDERLNAANDPRQRYNQQKSRAKQRGVAFELSFEQWRKIWGRRWKRRGRGGDRLAMGRPGDVGPYAVDNVQIITNSQNLADASRNRANKRRRISSYASEEIPSDRSAVV